MIVSPVKEVSLDHSVNSSNLLQRWKTQGKNVKRAKQRILSLEYFECEVLIHYSGGLMSSK